MTVYRIPPPAARSRPAAAGSLPAGHWLCGVAASYERWPQDRYTFHVPEIGLPLFLGHQERWFDSHGVLDGDVGTVRRFAEVDGIGLVCLIEVAADQAAILREVAEGTRRGLSIGYCLDPPPDGGPDWLYTREVSLTENPADPLARVVSSGQLALHDWEVLTGETLPAALRQAACPDGP